METIITVKNSASEYFCKLHDIDCNQKYNKTLPYSFHLHMVNAQIEKFIHLVNNNETIDDSVDRAVIFAAGYGHDSIEDARITYNDIIELFGQDVAEVIYLCTEERGRNRSERHSNVWFHQLKQNRLAVFVKLCDIIANVKFSLLTNSSMFLKYKSEYYQKVKPHLFRDEFEEMFLYLERLFSVDIYAQKMPIEN